MRLYRLNFIVNYFIIISGLAALLQLAAMEPLYSQQFYKFNKFTEPYIDLSGSVSLNNNLIWDDPVYKIPIGFSFKFFNQNFDSLYVSDYVWFDAATQYWIYALDADFIDRGTTSSLSPISYLLAGNPGSGILKIEWKNAGFYNDTSRIDSINVQLWLYEGTNDIEIHIGQNSVLNLNTYGTDEGGAVGVTDNISGQNVYLAGPASNPIQTTGVTTLSGTPSNGVVYRFAKCIFPVAGFGYSVDSNLAVSFYNSSVNGLNFNWDFGDFFTGIEPNPIHTYPDTGKYTVNFLVSNNCDPDTASQLVCVYPPASFTYNTTLPATVNFTCPNNNAFSYLWDFGDDSASALQNPVHAYGDTGSFPVKLTINYGCGPDTFVRNVQILFTGVREHLRSFALGVNLFPNPTSDVVNIEFGNAKITPSGLVTLVFTDLVGRIVLKKEIFLLKGSTALSLDISDLNSAIYTVKIISDGFNVYSKLSKL